MALDARALLEQFLQGPPELLAPPFVAPERLEPGQRVLCFSMGQGPDQTPGASNRGLAAFVAGRLGGNLGRDGPTILAQWEVAEALEELDVPVAYVARPRRFDEYLTTQNVLEQFARRSPPASDTRPTMIVAHPDHSWRCLAIATLAGYAAAVPDQRSLVGLQWEKFGCDSEGFDPESVYEPTTSGDDFAVYEAKHQRALLREHPGLDERLRSLPAAAAPLRASALKGEAVELKDAEGQPTALDDQHPVHHPNAMRSRYHILEAFMELLPDDGAEGEALEIASGTGAHVELFAVALPDITWQPSEYAVAAAAAGAKSPLAVIDAHGCEAAQNVRPAVALDASAPWEEWPADVREREGRFLLVFVANLFHITAWAVTAGALTGAARALQKGGVLVTYGPYKLDGKCSTESGACLDASMRIRNPEWGYRDVAEVAAEAAKHGLKLAHRRDMPASNTLLQFVKE